MKIDRIISLTIVGGLLDGLMVEFSSKLNCIIGARGTGKTSVLELVRYALNQLPKRELSNSARKRIESLVEGNLQGGRVELGIETRDGLRYTITRAVGEDPIVCDAAGNPTALSLDGHAFFHADIFSQNEVEDIADNTRFQLALIDSFSRQEIEDHDQEIRVATSKILMQSKQMEPLVSKRAQLAEHIKQLPLIEERLKAYASQGDEKAEIIDRAHALKALRDREEKAVEASLAFMGALDSEISHFAGRFKAELGGKFAKEMLDGPNGEIITGVFNKLSTCAKVFSAAISSSRDALADCKDYLQADGETLKLAHQGQDIAFRELVEKHKQHQAQSAERAGLERKRNEIKASQEEANAIESQIKKMLKQRVELIASLSEIRDRRFAIRKSVADRLNSALAPNIMVSVQQHGNPDAYQELIEATLKGTGVRQGMVAQKLVRTLPPARLAELVRATDTSAIMDQGDLNAEQATKLIAAFGTPDNLVELETVELQDEPSIKLKVGGQEKDSSSLSTGQKCTTILPILLLEGGNPLLIDQPEDNLDNRFIFETVVDNILNVKADRQLIFVTHNPNIPVLGDAELVMVMESDGDHAQAVATGSVDECKDFIITLLEGGEEAFCKRKERYKLF